MNDERPSEVLGGLPRTRPHRRSDKRGARAQSAPIGPEPATFVGQAPAPATPKSQAAAKVKAPAKRRAQTRPKATAPGTARAKAQASVEARSMPKAEALGNQSPAPAKGARLPQPGQPPGAPPAPASRRPASSGGVDILGTAVQAAAELAEIGLSSSARALRGAISRLPRP